MAVTPQLFTVVSFMKLIYLEKVSFLVLHDSGMFCQSIFASPAVLPSSRKSWLLSSGKRVMIGRTRCFTLSGMPTLSKLEPYSVLHVHKFFQCLIIDLSYIEFSTMDWIWVRITDYLDYDIYIDIYFSMMFIHDIILCIIMIDISVYTALYYLGYLGISTDRIVFYTNSNINLHFSFRTNYGPVID